ncbi:MAG: YihY/virulence factor BrkB family protein [Bacteroidales bacterium]
MTYRSKIKKSIDFVRKDIWVTSFDDLPPIRAFFLRQLQVMVLALRGMEEDKVYLRASGLTFFTLLSLVPVIAMAFGISKGFGLESYLEDELARAFTGREEVFEFVRDFAQSLLGATQGGVMAGIGLLILFYTVMKVLSHIEDAFNDIWQVNQARSYSRKFTDYIAMILIAPIFLVLSNLFTVFLAAELTDITRNIALLGYISPLIQFLVQLIPYVLLWIVFMLLYLIMPNTNVSFGSALMAALVAGTLFQLVQWGYIHFQVGVSRYNAIYGSFAALPLLLMWMQVSWLVVLFGAEISFAYQNVEHYKYESETRNMSKYNRRLITFYIANFLIRNFERGIPPSTAIQISNKLKIPIRLVNEILIELIDVNIVSATKTNYEKETAYQPALDINKISVKFLADKLDHKGMDVLTVRHVREIDELKSIMESFNQAVDRCPENKLLKDI